MHFERSITYEYWLSQSVSQCFINVLNAVGDGVVCFISRTRGYVLKSTCGLVVFIDMNTYILAEGRNFKTFLKKSYAVALDSYYLFTKNLLKMSSCMF